MAYRNINQFNGEEIDVDCLSDILKFRICDKNYLKLGECAVAIDELKVGEEFSRDPRVKKITIL